ncbi:MAG: transglutaminase-like domain-containing protein [Pirellulaceae bacterium]
MKLTLGRFVSILGLAMLLGDVAVRAEDPSPSRLKFGEQTTSQWRFGLVVKAPAGAVNGVVATMAVPSDFPEQKVKIVKEEISPNVKKVSYRDLGGVKQMIVSIPQVAAGGEASAIITFEIVKSEIEKPDDMAGLTFPKPAKELSKYLLPSPYIESTDPKIKLLAPTIIKDKEDGWQKVEAIFDYVQENVKYEFSKEIHPAVEALKAGKGDCEELTSLFIAFCRANKVPARAVWVPDHCYPEFYLQDSQGHGTWFPCQIAGDSHIFGWMPEERPILQKGDNFKVPDEKGPQRYVKQSFKAANADCNPEVRFVLEKVKE